MGRKPDYLMASVLIGAGVVLGDAALDNLEYVRETNMDSSKWHYQDTEGKAKKVLMPNDGDDYFGSLFWGFGELCVAAPLVAFGIGQATRRKED